MTKDIDSLIEIFEGKLDCRGDEFRDTLTELMNDPIYNIIIQLPECTIETITTLTIYIKEKSLHEDCKNSFHQDEVVIFLPNRTLVIDNSETPVVNFFPKILNIEITNPQIVFSSTCYRCNISGLQVMASGQEATKELALTIYDLVNSMQNECRS